jgi:hypothetical protein
MYNRKQRRKIEKELGLLNDLKKMSPAERKEVQKRKREMGREIHLRNTQERYHALEQSAAENSAKILQNLIASGTSEEDAQKMLASIQAKHEEREARIAQKKNK